MAISASQVQTSDTLEKFRQEFNKLRTDVNGLDSGTITVTTVSVQSSDFGNDGFTVSLAGADLTGNKTITFPDVNGTILTNANTDLGTITSTASDAKHVLVNDDGVLKRITPSDLGIAGNPLADDIQTGNANVNITTTSGQINIGPAQSDQDVNIKGTDSDGNTNFVAVNVDMSANGLTTFSDSIKIKNGGNIGNASVADVMTLGSTGIVTFKDDIIIKNTGTIGSAANTQAIFFQTSGGIVINENGNDVNFRIESDTNANMFNLDAGDNRIGIGMAATHGTLDVTGDIRTSTGILFGTDTAATNRLDDYEEGDWTPDIRQGGVAISDAGYDTGFTGGHYTKIGRIVHVGGSIRLTGKGSATGTNTVQLGGLPFPAANTIRARAAVNFFSHLAANIDMTGNKNGSLMGLLTNNSDVIEMKVISLVDGTQETLQFDDISDSFYLQFNLSYTV